MSQTGTLEDLNLKPMTRLQPGPGEVEIEVRAAALNFKDILWALGRIPQNRPSSGDASDQETLFGFECSGRIATMGSAVTGFKTGDEVVAVLAPGSLANYALADSRFVVAKPKALSFEEAATVGIAFLTASHALHHLARIRRGDRVLIHAAAGGVGQASIQIAQRAGAIVFGTASPEKWEFLKSQGVATVMNSRSAAFADDVLRLTSGQGVDVVLNSLGEEFAAANWKALGPGGRFVEIGSSETRDERRFHEHRPDASYYRLDLGEIARSTPELIASTLHEIWQEIGDGPLKPLPYEIFSFSDVRHAFRHMSQARHKGKVVVSIPQPASASVTHSEGIRPDGTVWSREGSEVWGCA